MDTVFLKIVDMLVNQVVCEICGLPANSTHLTQCFTFGIFYAGHRYQGLGILRVFHTTHAHLISNTFDDHEKAIRDLRGEERKCRPPVAELSLLRSVNTIILKTLL